MSCGSLAGGRKIDADKNKDLFIPFAYSVTKHTQKTNKKNLGIEGMELGRNS